jgi:hypothetical protein
VCGGERGFAAIMGIGSGAVGADGFSLKFLKIVLPTFFLFLLTCSITQSPLLHFPLLGPGFAFAQVWPF